MRSVVDKLQGAPREPPGDMGHCTGLRLGPDPPGWGPALPPAQQPQTPVHQPEGDQPAAADVTGKRQTTSAPSSVAKRTLRHQTSLDSRRI